MTENELAEFLWKEFSTPDYVGKRVDHNIPMVVGLKWRYVSSGNSDYYGEIEFISDDKSAFMYKYKTDRDDQWSHSNQSCGTNWKMTDTKITEYPMPESFEKLDDLDKHYWLECARQIIERM